MGRFLLKGAGVLILITGLLLCAYPVWSPWFYTRAQQQLENQYGQWLEPELPDTAVVPTPIDGAGNWVLGLSPGAPVGRIRIEKIGLEAYVVEGVSQPELARGPGRMPGSALPGMDGNLVIAGHRTTFGAPFRQVDRLEIGDVIAVQFAGRWHEYEVEESFSVKPSETWVTRAEEGAILTLITCHPPYSAAERLIVRARLR